MAEAYPHAAAASASTTTIKVSLDEWAIVDRNARAELMTDGLSGCVAVAIRAGDRLALTHVYSGALETFDTYKGPLGEFVAKAGSKAEITDVHIMHNGNPVVPKLGTNLPQMIERHLVDSGLVDAGAVHRHVDNGCTIADDGFFTKGRDNPALYRTGYTNTTLERVAEMRAKPLAEQVSHGGFAHSRDYLGPAEVEGPLRDGATVHLPAAKYLPPAPVVAAASSQEAAGPARAAAGHEALVPAISGPLGASKLFGMNRMPVSTEIARQAHAAGLERVDNVKVGEGGKLVSVIGGGRELEFAVSGRLVTLQPAPRAAELPGPAVPGPGLPASATSLSSPLPSAAMPSATPSAVLPSALSSTPYAQALAALEPHRETLKLQNPAHASEAAREIASQATRDGLGTISRLTLETGASGTSALVAHQDGPSAKQSTPVPVETLQRQVGAIAAVQSQPGPDKSHFPIM